MVRAYHGGIAAGRLSVCVEEVPPGPRSGEFFSCLVSRFQSDPQAYWRDGEAEALGDLLRIADPLEVEVSEH